MRLRVVVEVLDEETGKGTRRRREMEIPPRVLNVHKVLCESRKELRGLLADDVVSGALATVSNPHATDELGEAMLAEEKPARSPSRSPRRQSKMDSFLGLDVIEHMDKLESGGPQSAPEQDWGAVGWSPDKGR